MVCHTTHKLYRNWTSHSVGCLWKQPHCSSFQSVFKEEVWPWVPRKPLGHCSCSSALAKQVRRVNPTTFPLPSSLPPQHALTFLGLFCFINCFSLYFTICYNNGVSAEACGPINFRHNFNFVSFKKSVSASSKGNHVQCGCLCRLCFELQQ